MGNIDDGSVDVVLGRVDDELVGNLDLVGDVLTADLVRSETEGAAHLGASGALTPANGTATRGLVVARGVTESTTLLLILVADQLAASSTVVGALGA